MSLNDILFGTKAKLQGPWQPQADQYRNIYGNAQSLYNQAMDGQGAQGWGRLGNQMQGMGNQLSGAYNGAMDYAGNQRLEQDLSNRTNQLYNSQAYQNQMAATNDQITNGMNQKLAQSTIGANARGAAGSSRAALMDANIIGNAQNAMAGNNANMFMQAQGQVNQNAANQAQMSQGLGAQGMNYLTQATNYTPNNYNWNQLAKYQGAIGSQVAQTPMQGRKGIAGGLIQAAGAYFTGGASLAAQAAAQAAANRR